MPSVSAKAVRSTDRPRILALIAAITIFAAPGANAQNQSGAQQSQKPPIDFGSTASQQLSMAQAVVASIAMDGRDCEFDLHATKSLDRCLKFASQLSPGREYYQAMEVMEGMIDADPKFMDRNLVRLTPTMREVEEIHRIRNLLKTRIR